MDSSTIGVIYSQIFNHLCIPNEYMLRVWINSLFQINDKPRAYCNSRRESTQLGSLDLCYKLKFKILTQKKNLGYNQTQSILGSILRILVLISVSGLHWALLCSRFIKTLQIPLLFESEKPLDQRRLIKQVDGRHYGTYPARSNKVIQADTLKT